MKPFSELTRRELGLEILQWLCVLPAAALGAYVVAVTCGAASSITQNMSGDQYMATIAYAVRFFLFYIPKKTAFVFIGAKTAPRWRPATAFVLALMAIVSSLLVHILVQENVGTNNFAHFSAESIGALIGAAYLGYSEKLSDKRQTTA